VGNVSGQDGFTVPITIKLRFKSKLVLNRIRRWFFILFAHRFDVIRSEVVVL